MNRQSEALNKEYFQALGFCENVKFGLGWFVCIEHRPDSCILFYQGAIHSRSLFECPFSFSMSSSIAHAGLSDYVIQ